MIKFDKPSSWLQYADSETGLLGRHLERMMVRRRSTAVAAWRTDSEPCSLIALIPIGMLTLFMLWVVINPV